METMNRRKYSSSVTTGALGLVLIVLAACSSGESTTEALAPGGSAGLSGPMVFVNNTGDKTLTSVAVRGDSNNAVVNTISATAFEDVALGDMQFSSEDWIFVNLAASNKVATIDPLTAATPVHKTNLPVGTRPVHLYRDPTDGEIMWIMNDGDNTPGTTTPGEDLINCNNPARPGGAVVGGSVTILHNSHLGPGAHSPTVEKTVCVLAAGHRVTAFSSGAGVLKRAFVSSEISGEIAVIDNEPASPTKWTMIARIDLCNPAKETCDNESSTLLTTPFTPNNSGPHGIRWSKLTNKIYSFQEGYQEIAEIDPTTYAVTTINLAGTPYTGFGISPDGRYLLLRGQTPSPQATRLGVIDLSAATPVIADLATPELDGTSPGAFKFSPDSKRFYILAGNAPAATKKDRLFAYDWTTLAPPTLMLLREIPLVSTGAHSFDVLARGAGEARFLVVSNGADNSVSIINATDNLKKQDVTVGPNPTGVMVFESGAAQAGNQATN